MAHGMQTVGPLARAARSDDARARVTEFTQPTYRPLSEASATNVFRADKLPVPWA